MTGLTHNQVIFSFKSKCWPQARENSSERTLNLSVHTNSLKDQIKVKIDDISKLCIKHKRKCFIAFLNTENRRATCSGVFREEKKGIYKGKTKF